MATIKISAIDLLALKKLAIISGALAKQLPIDVAREQTALTKVLVDVISKADLAEAMDGAA